MYKIEGIVLFVIIVNRISLVGLQIYIYLLEDNNDIVIIVIIFVNVCEKFMPNVRC